MNQFLVTITIGRFARSTIVARDEWLRGEDWPTLFENVRSIQWHSAPDFVLDPRRIQVQQIVPVGNQTFLLDLN